MILSMGKLNMQFRNSEIHQDCVAFGISSVKNIWYFWLVELLCFYLIEVAYYDIACAVFDVVGLQKWLWNGFTMQRFVYHHVMFGKLLWMAVTRCS